MDLSTFFDRRRPMAAPPPAASPPPLRVDRPVLFAALAEGFEGFTEEGGDNQGQIVRWFQTAVDGKASGEAWCLAFVQRLVQVVDHLAFRQEEAAGIPGDQSLLRGSRLYPTEAVVPLWEKATPGLRINSPRVGCLILWQHYADQNPTGKGHVGIVVAVNGQDTVETIEGNTGPGAGIEREGDGVYRKTRSLKGQIGSMVLMGYLDPWRGVR